MEDSIRAVDRALDVLMCFSSSTPELSMTQITEKVGMHKSTVHRLLGTLEARKFVQRDPVTGRYRPGLSLLQLAFLTLERSNLREIATPYMHRLNALHLETVTLSIRDGSDMVYLAVLESPQKVIMAAKPGERLPVFSTASGKVVMAYSKEEFIKHILSQELPQFTSYTIRDEKTMFHILDLVRERGFAYSEQEYEEGINAVAAPIIDKNQVALASIAVAGPAFRLSVERMLEIGPSVAQIAREISKEIIASAPI